MNAVSAGTSEVMNAEYLIVGGGPAGIQATRLLRQRRPESDVLVIRPEPHSLVYCALPYAIEGLFPLAKTFKSDKLVTDTGAVLMRRKVVSVDMGKRLAMLDNGHGIRFGKLLIATGATPFMPPVDGAGLDNIFTVKTARDVERIMEALSGGAECRSDEPDGEPAKARTAVVVGAGAIGIEQALAYRALGVEVHLVDMADHPLPAMLDADMARDIVRELREAGVHLHLGKGLLKFHGGTAVSGVELDDGTVLPLREGSDFAVVSVGMKPDLAAFSDCGLTMKKDGIVVDAHMRTNIENVWAAGDCTHFHSAIDGQAIGGKLATNAVPMAKTAALDMLEENATYAGFVNGAATVVGALRCGGTGFTEAAARQRGIEAFATTGSSKTRFPMMPGAGDVAVKLIFKQDNTQIIGGQVVGTEAVAERIDVITMAIQRKLTARELAELSYSAQPWQTFFPAKNAIVEAAEKAAGLA